MLLNTKSFRMRFDRTWLPYGRTIAVDSRRSQKIVEHGT